MAVKVAINGFGRIGRLALRLMQNDPEFEIVALNDLTDAQTLAHLLKYDSAQGMFKESVVAKDDSIIVGGKEIPIFAEKDPANLPWAKLGVDVVLECTGFFTAREKAQAHIDAGAKHVVLSAPGSGDLKTVVFNVNHEILDGSEPVVSAASCTTNCLAPMAQVLQDKFGIVQGFMTTIHAYTNDQNTLDSPHKKDLRRARAAAQNIVPNTTGAAKAIGLVIPELAGKLDGSAQRVPVVTGSITELVVVLEKDVTVDQVNKAMENAANESFGYTEDPIVSSDIIGSTFGSLFDATQTKVITVDGKQLVKVAAFYDNEMGYTGQLVRTVRHFGELINK